MYGIERQALLEIAPTVSMCFGSGVTGVESNNGIDREHDRTSDTQSLIFIQPQDHELYAKSKKRNAIAIAIFLTERTIVQ